MRILCVVLRFTVAAGRCCRSHGVPHLRLALMGARTADVLYGMEEDEDRRGYGLATLGL